MDILTAYAVYMTGAILLVGMFAARIPYENGRTVFALALMWPLSLLGIAILVVFNATRWELDAARGTRMFGFRRPTNPDARGFAVTVFFAEVQIWKIK
jgi:hypothetical protein